MKKQLMLVVLTLCLLSGCLVKPNQNITGVVASVNVTFEGTFLVIVPDGDLTPQKYVLRGAHPEFWSGQHVTLSLSGPYWNDSYSAPEVWRVDKFQRIGPDLRK